jgi:rubrerythrin
MEAMKDMYKAAEKWGKEASDDIIKARAESCMASLIEMKLRIEKLPSAQPEPKTGRWIADGQKQKHGNEWMHCSVCGFSDIDVPATHTNYCPHCGAKMEGEDNETD